MDHVTCPNCGFIIDPRVYLYPAYCPKCGSGVEYYEVNYCPNCHPDGPEHIYDQLANDDKFCPECGGKTVLYDYIESEEN